MLTYVIRRLLLMIPTLLGVTAVVFFVMALSPGGVGGSLLSTTGEMEAEKAKALRDYYERRYGLNQPVIVQYARWLNQVSPIGFRTSAQAKFTDEQVAAARRMLGESPAINTNRLLQQAVQIATVSAGYLQQDLMKTAEEVRQIAEDPAKAPPFYQRMDIAMSDTFKPRFEAAIKEGPAAASPLVLANLSEEVNGKNRVLFNRPALKWPDLGESIAKGRPVVDLYAEALPITLLLNAITTPIIYLIAITSGIYAARHRGKFIDVTTGFMLLGLWSIPTMGVGVMLIGFLANDQFLRLFPSGGLNSTMAAEFHFLPTWTSSGFDRGWLLDRMWHLVLPIICLTYTGFAFISKLMRSAMLENLSADFVRTARAKGLRENVILWQHVFRNSLLPLITVAAHLIPGLLVGSVIVETIFSINGMGKLTIDAIYARDRDLVLAGTLVAGVLGLFFTLVADLLYAVADPRVSYE